MSRSSLFPIIFVIVIGLIAFAFYRAGSFEPGQVELENESSDLTANPARIPARTPEAKPKVASRKNVPLPEKEEPKAEIKLPSDTGTKIVISVVGRAIDTDNNPVVGANIELVSVNGPSEKIARTVSDGEGIFRFDDQIVPPQSKGGKSGTFNVFGTAPGYGFAWHGMRSVRFGKRPTKTVISDPVERGYYLEEECVMTLVFGRSQDVRGTIIDEVGDPVPDVSVSLSSCDFIDKEGKHSHVNYREFWGMNHLPESWLNRTTDLAGEFRFGNLPPECTLILRLKHPERSNKFAFAVTTKRDLAKLDLKPNVSGSGATRIQKSPMRIVMPSTHRLRVLCVHPWSKAPIAAAKVHAFRGGKDRQSSHGKTNAQGEVDLRLPLGTFTVSIDPPADTELIRTRHQIEIKDEPNQQEATLPLDVAAIVTLEAVDSKTGEGIEGVSFQYENDKRRIMQVQRNLSYIDNPTTDKDGKLEVLMRPGAAKLMVGYIGSKDHKSDHKFRHVELEGGKQITIRFKLDPMNK
ncbi:MAG: protocatechuate 3,4-dioxygenase beta subunit [Planctomycetota bacterium]|jgi:protocatechuate 3,4-dioxygenase beta subunit